MARLIWDNLSERYFETGVQQAVLFIKNDDGTYQTGVPWNGFVGVTEKHSGRDAIHVYSSESPFMDIYEYETFEATIEAYTYPDEFEQCDGFYFAGNTPMLVGFQDRKRFALCYKTIVGNDTDGVDHGYKIHILYDCLAKPAERDYNTINDSPDLMTFSWDLETCCVNISGFDPTPITIFDSRIDSLRKLESYLYGNKVRNSTLPSPNELISILATHYLTDEIYQPLVFGDTRIYV